MRYAVLGFRFGSIAVHSTAPSPKACHLLSSKGSTSHVALCSAENDAIKAKAHTNNLVMDLGHSFLRFVHDAGWTPCFASFPLACHRTEMLGH